MGKGLIQGLVIGVAAIVISVMIAFIIVQNVATVDDDIAADVYADIFNEAVTINSTTDTLATAGYEGFAFVGVHGIDNVTGGVAILVGNASITTAGVVSNATTEEWNNTYMNYTFTWTPTVKTADKMISNFTEGIDNVSSKIPTILLIAAVVLILGILALLWNQYQRMGMGSGSEL